MSDEREVDIVKDFGMFSISIRTDSENRQHAVVHHSTQSENPHTIESLPWGELMGRIISGVHMDDGRLVLTLSVRGSRP